MDGLGDEEKKEGAQKELVVNVSNTLDDYTQNVLHNNHVGLARMLYRCRVWVWQQMRVRWKKDCELVRLIGAIAG